MKSYRDKCIYTNDGISFFEKFHEESSLSNINYFLFEESISEAFDNSEFMYKIYDNLNLKECSGINLLDYYDSNVLIKKNNFENILKSRISNRNFIQNCVNINILSTLLLLSYGRTMYNNYTVPSAGGTYPIKLILIIRSISGIAPGVYEYNHNNACLHLISETIPNVDYVTLNTEFYHNCAFSIHFIGDPTYICYKYQDRGYRFMSIECGHIAQNLSLVATALEVGNVCSGGFLDGEFIKYLNSITVDKYSGFMYLYEIFFG